MNACTIIPRSRLPHARVLADSLASHSPETTLHALVIDHRTGDVDPANEPFELLTLDEVEIDRPAYYLAAYNGDEVEAVLKPFLLKHLLDSGKGDVVVYLGHESLVFADLRALEEPASRHGVVLAPFLAALPAPDGHDPATPKLVGGAGINRSFIALGKGGESDSVLQTWFAWIGDRATARSKHLLRLEQGWFDKLPLLAPGAHVLRDPGWCTSYATLATSRLSLDEGVYRVDGQPLMTFWFAGFNPHKPHILSEQQGDSPRVLVSASPAIAGLCNHYSKRLLASDHDDCKDLPYAFDRLSSGLKMTPELRLAYRKVIDDDEDFGDIFTQAGEKLFTSWLNGPAEIGGTFGLTRFLRFAYEMRPDLKWWLPKLDERDIRTLMDWMDLYGRDELEVPSVLIPWGKERDVSVASESQTARAIEGVNVVGFLRSEFGLGEAARKFVLALENQGVPLSHTERVAYGHREEHDFRADPARESARYPFNLLCLNGDGLLQFRDQEGEGFFVGRYNIGLWWWEVPTFPEEWREAFDYVNEIWVGSSYIADNLAKTSPRPVVKIPVPVIVETGRQTSREELGLPEGFVFLFVFDFFSTIERKNPVGLVQAYKRAFKPGDGATLVIKSIGGTNFPESIEKLRSTTDGRPDIQIIDEYYTAEQKDGLFAACDCYVSLHRAEGFGLTIAEAMYLGKPVIATGYSGNMEFMTDMNSYPVHYGYSDIPDTAFPYPPGPEWAEPDLDHAAMLMGHVFENREEAAAKGERAAAHMRTRHAPDVTGSAMVARLQEIAQTHNLSAQGPHVDVSVPTAIRNHIDSLAHRIRSDDPGNPPGGRLRATAKKTVMRSIRPFASRQRDIDLAMMETFYKFAKYQQDQLGALARRIDAADVSAMEAYTSLHDEIPTLRSELARALNDKRPR